jgi:2-polyprenyl-6-methoxyphenol hydroxylase-like FAD-dependent oxidoreductase
LGVDLALLQKATGIDPCIAGAGGPRLPVIRSHRDTASWYAIYSWLRRRVQAAGAIHLVEDCVATEAGADDRGASVACADGTVHRADIVVGADGYRSLVRGLVEPNGQGPRYAGYVGWRGLVQERTISNADSWPSSGNGFGVITAAGSP